MCAHVRCVRCAPRTHWRTAQKQLIATFLTVRYSNAPWSSCCSFTKRGGAKNTAVLKKLCIENGISFMKLTTFHKIRCYSGAIRGAYQTPSPGTHLSNSLKKLCAPLNLSIAIYLQILYYFNHVSLVCNESV
jgi:hypothetical protein